MTPDEHSKLVDAMVKAESAGNPKAVSKAGAKGLAQLMDATGEEWSKKLGYAKYDPFDEKQNKHIGGEYLKWLVNKFGGDVKLGLASYNAGIGNVLKALAKAAKAGKSRSFENALAYLPKPEETGPYVKRVMKNYQA